MHFKHIIKNRKDSMYNYYNSSIGDRIKRRRKELNLTQEALANQICSNTYISKMENNKTKLNPEVVSLIMEKMELSEEYIDMPQRIIDNLGLAVRYFFYNDVEKYTEIIESLVNSKSNVLVYIIRLGYYVLTENYVEAKIYKDELTRYVNNLEEYGFSTFCIFTGYYYLGVNDYQRAKEVVESTEGYLLNDNYQIGLYNYLGYLAYGNLHLHSQSSKYMEMSNNIFKNKNNFPRLAEISMYNNMFNIYEGSKVEIENLTHQLSYLTDSQRNRYLFVLSLGDIKNRNYRDKIDKESIYYILNVFLSTLDSYESNNTEKYKEGKEILKRHQFNYEKNYDFFQFFMNLEKNNYSLVQEFLKKDIEESAKNNQNIYLYKWINEYILRMSVLGKRYKNGVDYTNRINKKISTLQKKDPIN